MPSGLRAKLRGLSAAASDAPKAKPRGGLLCYAERQDLAEGLMELPAAGLRRIGWSGRAFDARRCLFLDTETTGLSGGAGTVAFLVGVGFVEGDHFTIEQYLMRDYGDEPELIDRLANRMDGFDYVCTFNGRTFDMPLLEARFTMTRMRHRWREMENLDLLHPARRAWKLRLGSCRLSRLEELILGCPRTDDLPGSEVPKRYFEFLKTGDMALLDDIVRHNRQDVATLSTLLVHLCRIYDRPETLTERRDLFSIGKALEKQGELGPARELYRVSAIPSSAGTLAALSGERVAGMANWQLYLLSRKNRNYEEMRAVLEQMLSRRQMPFEANIELSKWYEHHAGDCARALEYARAAQKHCPPEQAEAVERRVDRLLRKTGKSNLEE